MQSRPGTCDEDHGNLCYHFLAEAYKDLCLPAASGSQTQASGPVDANEHITDLASNELNCFE